MKPADETHPYSDLYLQDAMQVLGEFFEYGVHDYGAEGAELAELFCISPLSKRFGRGEARLVGGMSGAELFFELDRLYSPEIHTYPEPAMRLSRTPEFWLGWTAAFVQWDLDLSFSKLFDIVPYDEFLSLYYPWHEASEQRFSALVVERAQSQNPPTQLARLRRDCGLTQEELAARTGVSLSSLRMYEQRHKDINKAQAATLLKLARELHCAMEDLMEPTVLRHLPAA